MDRNSFKNAWFHCAFARARLSEIWGNYNKARLTLGGLSVPDQFHALRDAYDVRLASIEYARRVTFDGLATNPPDRMLHLISQAQTRLWYWRPRSPSEEYASRYVDYVEAAILGNGEERDALALNLRQLQVSAFLKRVLLVT